MSRQLAFSASISILVMSAFALSHGVPDQLRPSHMQTGAAAHATAPALPERLVPLLVFTLG